MIDIEELNEARPLNEDEANSVTGGVLGQVAQAFAKGYRLGTRLDNMFKISDAITGTGDADHLIITPEVKNAGNPK